ncbi:MAG: prepilin-type N-terminal cleavage/methylation domain-containing protein [Kiritimatiellae bacterium]|nr:prepilin-type N-terminal cleavage/methylation domain-containing protein [Kiritimatiellia bacterium]MCB1101545.1 prepilin-type N-terminal cleavage/methylation domain-containing protein [Kiritimatiellia bacterium]
MVTRKQRRQASRAGLTLVEVILALVILGTALTALIAAASRALSVVRQAKNLDTSRELFGVLEVMEPIQPPFIEDIEEAAGSGSFERPYENYRWERTVEVVGDEEDGLWLLTMTISWKENERQRSESVQTYVYWPEDTKGGSFERAP